MRKTGANQVNSSLPCSELGEQGLLCCLTQAPSKVKALCDQHHINVNQIDLESVQPDCQPTPKHLPGWLAMWLPTPSSRFGRTPEFRQSNCSHLPEGRP